MFPVPLHRLQFSTDGMATGNSTWQNAETRATTIAQHQGVPEHSTMGLQSSFQNSTSRNTSMYGTIKSKLCLQKDLWK